MFLRLAMRLLVVLSQACLALHFFGVIGRPSRLSDGDILAGCAATFIAAMFVALAVWERKSGRITAAR